MIAGEGGLRVPAPACRPSRYGLASVADVAAEGGFDWARGLEWDELACGYDAQAVSGQCPTLEEQRKASTRGFDTRLADAFAVYAGWGCSAVGATAEAWDNAEQLLDRNWWRAVELALWTGVDQDANAIEGSFESHTIEDLTPPEGALDVTSGLATLESFYGDCTGCEGVVHANRGLGVFMAERHLLNREGGALEVWPTGTRVAIGSGYPSSGPGGVAAAADEAWMYITGAVSVRHSPVFFAPARGDLAGAVDRETNDVEVFAERFVALQVGCCVGAVLVTLDSCCPSGSAES